MMILPPQRVLTILLLICCWTAVSAQRLPDFTASEPAEMTMPQLNALSSSWWDYFEIEPEETAERVGAFQTSLRAGLGQLAPLPREEAATQLDSIAGNFAVYLELRRAESPEPAPLPPAAAEYSLEQYLRLAAGVRAAERIASADELEVTRARQQLQSAMRRRDLAFRSYVDAAPGDDRWLAGLKLVRARSDMAIAQQRLMLLDAEKDRSSVAATELWQRQQYARARISVPWDSAAVKAANTVAEKARTAEAEARMTLQEVELAFAVLDLTAPQARSRELLQRQRLNAAQITHAQRRLERAAADARLWLTLLASPEEEIGLGQLTALQLEWNQLADEVRQSAINWKADTEAELLIVQAIQQQGLDPAARRLLDQRLEITRSNLTRLRDLADTQADLRLVIELVRDASVRDAGRLRSWLAGFSVDTVANWKRIVALADTSLFDIGDAPITGGGLLRVLIIILIAVLISRGVRHALERMSAGDYTGSRASLYTFGRLFHYVAITVGLLIALSSIGLNLGNMVLIAGALGIGIGFGLQSIVNNFVSGLIILFEQSLRVGDYIELDTGLTGSVKAINVRSTLINTNDNIDIVVPNSEFISTKLTNWTLAENILRMRVPFQVAYGTDKDLVKKAALEAADKVTFTLRNMKGREPDVWLVEFGESSMNFLLLVWVNRQGARRPTRTRSAYLWQLDTIFQEYGISVPFPQRDVHIRSAVSDRQANA